VAILVDESRAQRLGAAGRRRFLARFSAAHMVEETLKIYDEVA
jgi:glycosyltransferase involved in cell wall biosynthesis